MGEERNDNNMSDQNEKIELTFAEKHPKLNMALGILIMLGLVVIGFFFIKYLLKYVVIIGQWAVETLGKVDAVIIVALITGGVSVLCMAISKYIEYRQSRMEYLTQKREIPYRAFIDMVYKLQQNKNDNNGYSEDEMMEDITAFSKDLTLWGSKRVVNKWIQFRMNSVKGNTKPTENLFVLEGIMNEMRKDLGIGKTHKGRLLAFFVNDIDKYL